MHASFPVLLLLFIIYVELVLRQSTRMVSQKFCYEFLKVHIYSTVYTTTKQKIERFSTQIFGSRQHKRQYTIIENLKTQVRT
jgi:hypothetical protein